MASDHKSSTNELLLSFHKQFAENQNHHQKLLISLVSAIGVVLVGYATAYINTTTQANLWETIRDKDAHIISYSMMTLVFAYTFSQIILVLLGLMNLNIGYAFRRDQQVNKNIRIKFLANQYNKIFGENTFNPSNKKINEYLPGFNYNFQICLISVQAILLQSLLFAIYNSKSLSSLFSSFLGSVITTIILSVPVFGSLYFVYYFFKKYKRMIEELTGTR